MLSCQRCKQTNNGPQAFLLTCRGCNKSWHHRCHMPPVEDNELMQRIRATNLGDANNDLSTWTCRRCKKAGSATPSVMSSREPTVSSESHDDRKSLTSSYNSPAITAGRVASTADVRVKQKQEFCTGVDARPLSDREQGKKSGRQESTEAAPVKRALTAKRTTSSAPKPPHVQPRTDPTQPRDVDVQMTGTTPTELTPQEEKKRSPDRSSFQTPFHQDTSIQKSVDIVSATSPEDDVEMRVDVSPPTFSESTSRATSRTSQAPSSDSQTIRRKSVAEVPPHSHAASLTNEREREVRLADGVAAQPRVNQDAEDDDDPEDLYGPPVERRIIRILPSLAEELRDQRRRAAAEKEVQGKLGRAPLAPDWIFARHVHDPLWKEIRPTVEGRKRRKPTARKLGDNGLNVNELVGYLTLQNSVREHKT